MKNAFDRLNRLLIKKIHIFFLVKREMWNGLKDICLHNGSNKWKDKLFFPTNKMKAQPSEHNLSCFALVLEMEKLEMHHNNILLEM